LPAARRALFSFTNAASSGLSHEASCSSRRPGVFGLLTFTTT